MSNWENSWDNFSKKELREELEQDNNIAAVCQQLIDYINARREEVAQQINFRDDGYDTYPKDCCEHWSLDAEIEGHKVKWEGRNWSDRDGGNEESETELYIDGKQVTGFYGQYASRPSKEAWELDELLCDLAGMLY